jgi:hypothetical protein
MRMCIMDSNVLGRSHSQFYFMDWVKRSKEINEKRKKRITCTASVL